MTENDDGGFSWQDTAREFRKATPSSAALNSASPVAVVLNYWKEFDLESARGKLDDQGLKIAEHQESSLKNRRKLAETTRDFKKANNEDKVKMFGPLLKAYQEEVDNLTKRSKFSENAFLNVYQKLYEAPDPVPALATGAETVARLGDLETENRKFRQELEEFRAESAHLKNQQATVRRLEERNRQLEQQMEEKVKELVEVRQKVLAEESQKNLELLRERENALYEQLRAARDSVRTMQQLQESTQNQLFEYKAQSDEEKAAKQSELNLLTDEVERAQQRLLSIEKEKETLKAQVTNMQDREPQRLSDSMETEASSSSSLEASLSAKEKMISELHAELHSIETALSTERDSHVAELRKLHLEIDEKEATIAQQQAELLARPTLKQLDDLKKQVKILQAVGYNSIEAQDWEVAARGEEIGKLESLLLDKNRKMEHELTQLKVQLAEKTAEAEVAATRIAEMTKDLANQKILISALEEDILRGSSTGGKHALRSDDWEASEVGLNSLVQRHDAAEEEENSMLTVVCGQRDRFRQRLTEAEEELRKVKDRCRVLQEDLKRKEADNVKLYERMRYVSEYGKDRGPSGRAKKRVEDLEAGNMSDADILKYKKIYEEDINPFAAFTKKEKEQRYKELGFRERITLSGALFFLGNRYGRMFLFFYSIFLHLLVFAAMYRLSATSRSFRLSYSTHDRLPSVMTRNRNLGVDNFDAGIDQFLNSTLTG